MNRLVAGACPARWQFFVYLLVYRTQKEDMRFTPSIFGKLLGPIKRRPFVTLVERHAGDAYVKSFPSWNHLVALVYTSAPRPSACEGWKQVGTPIASIITIWAALLWCAGPGAIRTNGHRLLSSPRLSAGWQAN